MCLASSRQTQKTTLLQAQRALVPSSLTLYSITVLMPCLSGPITWGGGGRVRRLTRTGAVCGTAAWQPQSWTPPRGAATQQLPGWPHAGAPAQHTEWTRPVCARFPAPLPRVDLLPPPGPPAAGAAAAPAAPPLIPPPSRFREAPPPHLRLRQGVLHLHLHRLCRIVLRAVAPPHGDGTVATSCARVSLRGYTR